MKTPVEFIKNIESKVITIKMLELALYSLNKRAKNCRDKKNEYYNKGRLSNYKRYFESVDQYKSKEKEYYSLKELILKKVLAPECIHREVTIYEEEITYYDYDVEYSEMKEKAVYEGNYFDEDTGDFVDFIDVIKEVEVEKFYLYYKTDNCSFHIPISKFEVDSLILERDIEIINIDRLVTYGKEVGDLVSVQFVKKIVDLINSEDYHLINA